MNNSTVGETLMEDPPAIRYTRLFLYPLIFAVGVAGNSLVCALILKNGKSSSANGYFILNLAISDLMALLLYLPFDLVYLENSYIWPFGTFLCKFINCLSKVSVTVSGSTLVAISYDRYRAIVHSLRGRLSQRQAMVIMACIWVYSALLQLPYAFALKLMGRECIIDFQFWGGSELYQINYVLGVFTPEFVIPAIAITLAYTRIVCHLKKTHKKNSQHGLYQKSTMAARTRQNKKTTKVLTGLVTIYSICILPHMICVLMVIFNKSYLGSFAMRLAYEFTRLLTITNSCLNPLLYGAISKSFRTDLRNFLRGRRGSRASMKFLRSSVHMGNKQANKFTEAGIPLENSFQ
ncbi:predicted protein [Nematostella vectensis]|uniref:G-protein coupled receptors family 1 profile domain-containing protein n=1 Tax=Nematostella vectensis TaxID=45351 RepID=A7RIF2_NEMVE|nr:predicted protein [Nematostella vectensis]|eukprot:XP_001640865.1 predicted protein [Nematostella vectensis]